MSPPRQIPRERLQSLVRRPDCATGEDNALMRHVLEEPGIRDHRPEPACQVDPRDGLPIVYSMARALRPHDTTPAARTGPAEAACPVCAGNTTGILDVAPVGDDEVTFINLNLFPIVYPPTEGVAEVTTAAGPAAGAHFLQWTSDRHDVDVHNAPVAHVATVLARLAALEANLLHRGTRMPVTAPGDICGAPHHGYVVIIKNRGHNVGGSLVHGHQQIVHTNICPQRIRLDAEFAAREGRSFAQYMLDDNPPALTLDETDGVRWVTPQFLRRPLQALGIVTDTRKSHLHELGEEELRGLARGIRHLTARVHELMPGFGMPVAYNLVFHTGPIGGLYVELLPWTQQYGGYEQAGLFVVCGTPEHSHGLLAGAMEAAR